MQVYSSNGTLELDDQGFVKINESTYDGDELRRIIRFDLAEYLNHYRVSEMPETSDILDLGYWHLDLFGEQHYEEPAHEWRVETAELRKNGGCFIGNQAMADLLT